MQDKLQLKSSERSEDFEERAEIEEIPDIYPSPESYRGTSVDAIGLNYLIIHMSQRKKREV